MLNNRDLAEAFCRHQFEMVIPRLNAMVRWEMVGGGVFDDVETIAQMCADLETELVGTTTEFVSFDVIDAGDRVMVDSVAIYTAPDHMISTVASCDIFTFHHNTITIIRSHTTEL